jgi:hypothetical protein
VHSMMVFTAASVTTTLITGPLTCAPHITMGENWHLVKTVILIQKTSTAIGWALVLLMAITAFVKISIGFLKRNARFGTIMCPLLPRCLPLSLLTYRHMQILRRIHMLQRMQIGRRIQIVQRMEIGRRCVLSWCPQQPLTRVKGRCVLLVIEIIATVEGVALLLVTSVNVMMYITTGPLSNAKHTTGVESLNQDITASPKLRIITAITLESVPQMVQLASASTTFIEALMTSVRSITR